ncbi:hypothetical protein DS2_05480 [Catenovulum agarivorans DS-2]|uniref:Uncharacterized protein n=1 Tax=Catenovulum agarivorans DS-2 TaxID=1328313 RepID=W7QDL3_9ALTE|nr:YacL family protein [Catenovulum agarivorans]EWH10994.1 hypothetical protein DS2_05480 [Catenovulum agarivorans DS-2]
MEFDFFRDANGVYTAEFSSEQESFGYWFTDEFSTNKHKIAEVLNIIIRLERKEIQQHLVQGKTHQLILEQSEVQLMDNAKPLNAQAYPNHAVADDSEDDETPEQNVPTLSDDALLCGCGLVDFKQALKAWLNFISED